MRAVIKSNTKSIKTKDGFTLIEVMLVLGITGLILLGLLGGTFSSIAHQRYNDSLRNFSEYLSLNYSEVLSPESIGDDGSATSIGDSETQAILGKILVFGRNYGDEEDDRSVFSATLVGNADINSSIASSDFISDIMSTYTNLQIVCSTVSQYTPLWQARLTQASAEHYNPEKAFTGTIIIARTPFSSAVHTIYANELTYPLKDACKEDALQSDFAEQRDNVRHYYSNTDHIGICVESDNSAATREVRIAADGRNTSAISMLTEEDSECR